MAKYKCKILQRQSKDKLIVDATSLKTREPKPPKRPTIRELILSLTNRVGNIEIRLDGIDKRLDNIVIKNNLKE